MDNNTQLIKVPFAKDPVNIGYYDELVAQGITSFGIMNRVNRYGCEWESLVDNNTDAPAVWDGGDTITPSENWKLNAGNPDAWLMNHDKPATSEQYPFNGMGRVRLKKNIVDGVNTLTQAMLTHQNTIYVIQYDFTLGEDITVPVNCVLEFDGGSFVSDIYTFNNDSNILTVDGYGFLCKVTNYNNLKLNSPTHVSTVNGLKTGADGSLSKPFYYLQDALEISNDIRIERGTVFWIDQALYTRSLYPLPGADVYKSVSIGRVVHDVVIDVYGYGKNPLFCGIGNFGNNSWKRTELTGGDIPVVGATGCRFFQFELNNNAKLVKPNNFVPYSIEDIDLNINSYLLNIGASGPDSRYIFTISNIRNRTYKDADEAYQVYKKYGNIETMYYNGTLDGDRSENCSYFKKFVVLASAETTAVLYENTVVSTYTEGLRGERDCNITISNCDFVGLVNGMDGPKGYNVSNCSFNLCGGHVMRTEYYKPRNGIGWVRWGNGLGNYITNNNVCNADTNFIVRNCTFNNIFDTAITLQGYNITYKGKIIIENNVVSNTRMGVEFFNTYEGTPYSILLDIIGNTFNNCSFHKTNLWYPWGILYGNKQTAGIRFNRGYVFGMNISENHCYNSALIVDAVIDKYGQTWSYSNYRGINNNFVKIKEGDCPIHIPGAKNYVYLNYPDSIIASENALNKDKHCRGNILEVYRRYRQYPEKAFFFGNSLLVGMDMGTEDINDRFGMAAPDNEHDYFYLVTKAIKALNHITVNSTKYKANTFETTSTLADAKAEADNVISACPSDADLIVIQCGTNVHNDTVSFFKDGLDYLCNGLREKAINARFIFINGWAVTDNTVYNAVSSIARIFSGNFIDINSLYMVKENRSYIGAVVKTYTTDRTIPNVTNVTELSPDQGYSKKIDVTFTVSGTSYTTTINCNSYSLNSSTLSYNSDEYVVKEAAVALHPGELGFKRIANKILNEGGFTNTSAYYD